MNLVKTKSFTLAVISRGYPNSKMVALCLPGRLDTKDYHNNLSHLEYLASKGFYALSFDPPGSWDSPGGMEIYTTTNYIRAVNELIEYLGNRPTLLMGHSRGGTVSMIVGTSNPSVVGFVAVMATYGAPSSPTPETLISGIQMSYRDLPPGDKRSFSTSRKTEQKKEFALPISYFKDGEQYDPLPALRQCTKPKLLFYGTNDSFTEPEEVKQVFESIPEPKMIHELETEHDYRYHKEIVEEVNQILGQFLDKYILN